VFIKCLEPSCVSCCVWCSGLVEHCHASVCVIHAWVPTKNSEYSIIVVLIQITTKLLFVCYSFNSWFSADIISEPSPASTSMYSWFRLGEFCVLLIAYDIGRLGGGGGIANFLHLQHRISVRDLVLWILPIKSYHSLQSDLSSTSCLIVLFFWVLCAGPAREYHELTMNML
jgi:hypothetical protein